MRESESESGRFKHLSGVRGSIGKGHWPCMYGGLRRLVPLRIRRDWQQPLRANFHNKPEHDDVLYSAPGKLIRPHSQFFTPAQPFVQK